MDMSEALPPVQPAGIPASASGSSTRAWEVLCHLSAIAGLLGFPLGNILGPLIIWLVKKDASPGVDAHGKESLNFHISWTIYAFVVAAVAAVLTFVLIGIFIWPLLAIGWVAMIVLVIIGSVKASNGELYRYPLTIRFLN
jgi:uncharacterized Tic20 family protein